MSSMTFYGLKTCDTCRKAQKELRGAGREFAVIDVRADGVSTEKLQIWAGKTGWNTLLNTRSTSWRNLDATDKDQMDEARAIKLMTKNPTLIKRPVIELGAVLLVGWNPQTKQALGL